MTASHKKMMKAMISRRGMLGGLAAGGAALLLAGCDGSGQKDQSEQPAKTASEQKPAPANEAAHAHADEKVEYVNKALLEKNPIIEDIVLGSPDAPVTMVEYASATCPHCADFHIHELPLIKKEFVDTGKVKFIFREFPLDQVALAAFMLTRCASGGDAKKYSAVLDMVMKTQRDWAQNPKDGLMKIMRMAGLSDEAFDKCLKDEKLAKKIMNSARNASRDFRIESTPTFFINGRRVTGRRDIAEFRRIIEEELKRAGAK